MDAVMTAPAVETIAGLFHNQTMTPESFEALPSNSYRYEYIGGKAVVMSPAGGRHGRIATRLIGFFSVQIPQGYHLYDSSTGYRLPNGDVRSPDLSIIAPGRLPGELDPIGFLEIPPDLAIEIISPSERYEDVIIKVREYLGWGVKAVWVVEPATSEVVVHSTEDITRLIGEDELCGGDAAPGFAHQVNDLFPG